MTPQEIEKNSVVYLYRDLPGQAVSCSPGKQLNKVVTRKHRDVLFDIFLGDGAKYEIRTSLKEDFFYYPKEKKITNKATFNDGSKCNIWLSRYFKGDLLLFKNGKIEARYPVGRMIDNDPEKDHPNYKPAPLIVHLRTNIADHLIQTAKAITANTQSVANQALASNNPLAQMAGRALDIMLKGSKEAAKLGRPENVVEAMMVVEIKTRPTKDVQQELVKFFDAGAEDLVLSGTVLTAVSRNWLLEQFAGTAVYVKEGWRMFPELWKSSFSFQTLKHRGGVTRNYVCFKLTKALKAELMLKSGATRMLVTNAKAFSFTYGAGSWVGTAKAAGQAGINSFKGGGGLVVLFAISMLAADWWRDYEMYDEKTGKRQKDVFNLAASVGCKIGSVFAGGVAGSTLSSLILRGIGASATSVAGGWVIALGWGVVFLVGYGLDWIDKKVGFSDVILPNKLREASRFLGMEMPEETAYQNLETQICPSSGALK